MTILNFHGLGPIPREIDAGEYDCWLDIPRFEAILDRVQGNAEVSITFDDGNVSDYEIALPALLRRGMRAVFFICSGRTGQATFLNDAQIRELAASGMMIGSHGVSHKPWRNLDSIDLEKELAGSRVALEQVSGRKVDLAACPFGSYDRRVLAALKCAGYRAVFTSDGGFCNDAQWLRPRITIRRSFTPDRLEWFIKSRSTMTRRLLDNTRILFKRNRPRPLRIRASKS